MNDSSGFMATSLQTLSNFPPSLPVVALFFGSILYVVINAFIGRRARITAGGPYPPGPKGHWYVGFKDIPMKKPWLRYIEMGKHYGSDLVHFSRFGKHYLVINSLEAATEILEKNARVTSDRPSAPLDQIAGWQKMLGLTPYSDEWRKTRRLFHQNFRAEATSQFRPVQEKRIRKFVNDLTSSKEALIDQISTLSQTIMFNAVYGLDISTNKESMPQHARELVEINDWVLIPGWDGFKYLPFVHLLPSWFPGGQFRASHLGIRKAIDEIVEGPWNMTMNAMKSDDSHSSLIANLLYELQSETDEEIDRIKNMGGQAVAAAADTTMSAISTFFLAMSLYPNVQQKAQQELDTVLGPGKLPTFEDRASLPYVEAVYREVMRWHPAIPMGLPHVTADDVFYRGYFIPKGTSIHANIW
ncbi:cytochrome p450 [Stygiomarasmius scandens]|uniref:Cytochrome p450 n=1 Tax=Marasmiellus scandens TaxID=2682957 RepID=A0ABR1INC4_9AGAR